MAISLKSLKSSSSSLPPRIILHAVEGMGKTSLAAEFPSPLYLHTSGEATPAGIDIPSVGQIDSYEDFRGIGAEIANEAHDFRTLIVDAVDGLEPIIWAETCFRNNWKSVEEPGFGKGYKAVDEVWREVLSGFDYLRENRNMAIILIAHSDRVNFEEPGKTPYKRYDLRVHSRAQGILCDWADAIFFVNSKTEIKQEDAGFNRKATHAEGGGVRWIFTDARPAFVAKNRAANMPPQILYKKGEGFNALAPHLGYGPQTNAKNETVAA